MMIIGNGRLITRIGKTISENGAVCIEGRLIKRSGDL